jgi:hypothetical protein
VQRFEDRDEVVAACQLGVGGITLVKRHALLDSAADEIFAGTFDRCVMRVDSVDLHLRVGAGDLDDRAALAARDVGHPRRRIGEQSRSSGTDGSHSFPSRFSNNGRVKAAPLVSQR